MNGKPWGARLARWHRRAGIIAALFVILLSFTGLLLQHAPAFGLDRAPVGSATLARLMGYEQGPIRAFRVQGRWILGNGTALWRGRERVAAVEALPDGVAAAVPGLAVAAGGDIYLFDGSGRLLERLRAGGALPGPAQRLGRDDAGTVVIEIDGRIWRPERNWLDFSPRNADAVDWSRPRTPPPELARLVRSHELATAVSWEQLLLALHSGRLLGPVGVVVMDAAALALLLLAGSGLFLWWRRR